QGNGVLRVIRPYPLTGGSTAHGIVGHRAPGEKGTFLVDVPEERLRQFIPERQEAGERITSLAACAKDGQLLYAVVSSSNPDKVGWTFGYNLPVEQFKARTVELAGDGHRPASVTICPWDGAVRYCVIWAKDR